MAIDDSFKKPGAIPFHWEIRPGVPKLQPQQHHQKPPLSPPTLSSPSSPFYPSRPLSSRSPSPSTPSRRHQLKSTQLKPPPQRSPTYSDSPRAGSFRSAPHTRSERWHFEQPQQPECVSSPGCFPASPFLLKRKYSFKSKQKSNWNNNNSLIVLPEAYDWSSGLEMLSRWSVSSRISVVSPFCDSPLSSSFSSYQSSPLFLRPVVSDDPEWAGFGLF